jgi:hypothetical protein
MKALAELLEQTALDGVQSNDARRGLRWPCCRPLDGRLVAVAENLCADAERLEPGMAVMLAVDDLGRSPSLWLASPRAPSKGNFDSHFDHQTTHYFERAHALAIRNLLAISPFTGLEPRTSWFPIPVYKHGDRWAKVVKGRSLELSICLAVASKVLGRPIPSGLCASAAVETSGELDHVEGLDEKVSLVARTGLGLSRLLVSQEDEGPARAAAANQQRLVDVVGVRNLADALQIVFGDVEHEIESRLISDDQLRNAIEELFREALHSDNVYLPSKSLLGLAQILVKKASHLDPGWQWKAQFAQAIIARHLGLSDKFALPNPAGVLSSLPRPLRLEVMAHWLQDAADNPASDCEARIAQVRLCVSEVALERHEGDLKVLGAMGRLLAANGADHAAAEVLREAIEGWQMLGQVPQMSYALCEYLRILGIARQAEAVRRVADGIGREFACDPETSSHAIVFYLLTLGRAFIQCGLFDLGARELQRELAWDSIPHVQASRLRWLARAEMAMNHKEAATSYRTTVRQMAAEDSTLSEFRDLVRDDIALEAETWSSSLGAREDVELRASRCRY